MIPILLLALPWSHTSGAVPGETVQLGLRVPAGFEVVEFADTKLADDIYCMALDPRGRVVVSGRGYLRILVDDDGDGRADRALDFAEGPRDGAMGLLWEGDSLFVTGDGGLRRFRATKGRERADGPSELIRAMKTGGEHQAHALRRGPDGWLYLLGGDGTGFDSSYSTLPTSPIRQPIGGCVVRFRPDFTGSEIVADGFRNAYSMDFNADGELFTFDSDNERCVSLPWYEPTRFYHVAAGGHHGWLAPQRAPWWRLPPYLVDVAAPVATLGRGSPTGVACYRHRQFPEHYRGGFFLLDWTFGRVYFCKLERAGASYVCKPEIFLESVGDNGFAPTAVAIHPGTGDLYVSIGGRGTRGAIYRIRYPRGLRTFNPAEIASLQPKPLSLDWAPSLKDSLASRASSKDLLERAQALRAVRRHHRHFSGPELVNVVRANWEQTDRPIIQATAEIVALLDKKERQDLGESVRSMQERATFDLALVRTEPAGVVNRASELLATAPPAERGLTAVRLLQLGLGDLVAPSLRNQIWAGYSPRSAELANERSGKVPAAVGAVFPTGHADLDRELARVLAMLETSDAGLAQKVAAKLTADSHPVEDFHYLAVLARMKGHRSRALTHKTAEALLALDRKIARRRLNRERNWTLRLIELYADLARRDPSLHGALLGHADFGRPDHALFALSPGFDRRRAAEVFLSHAAKAEDYPWNAEVLEVIGGLPPEQSAPVLRRLWGKVGLDEVILPILAQHPAETDREKYLDGLKSPQLATMRLSLEALGRLPNQPQGPEVLAFVRALRRLADAPEENRVRQQIGAHLRRATGQDFAPGDTAAWTVWFSRTHPSLAGALGGPDGVDVGAWGQRLLRIEWQAGDPSRGRQVFQKASCAGCHSGTQALGPDLHGVAGRFSRDDVFTAILQPSKDISPRYRTTLISTDDGKVYQGMIVYEATDGVLLQTGPAATVRIPGAKIATRRFTNVSLMPVGLLDKLTDGEIADLYAYLRTLSGQMKR